MTCSSSEPPLVNITVTDADANGGAAEGWKMALAYPAAQVGGMPRWAFVYTMVMAGVTLLQLGVLATLVRASPADGSTASTTTHRAAAKECAAARPAPNPELWEDGVPSLRESSSSSPAKPKGALLDGQAERPAVRELEVSVEIGARAARPPLRPSAASAGAGEIAAAAVGVSEAL